MSDKPQHDHINGRIVIVGFFAILCMLMLVATTVDISVRQWGFRFAGANAALDFSIATPQLLSAPRADRAAFMSEKKKLIDSYRWNGRSSTAVIPIDVAMQLSIKNSDQAIERAQRGER